MTNEENQRNTVAVGWYSKEDMVKVLHWNANLVLYYRRVLVHRIMKNVKDDHLIYFKKETPNSFWLRYLGISNTFRRLLRKKISGAIKICEMDPLHLVRTEKKLIFKQFHPWYLVLSYKVFSLAGHANMVVKRNTMFTPARLVPWSKTDSKRMSERRSARTSV